MTVAELDALDALDREHLHVFVAGPGQGEGIAVALPGIGWVLVDGCTTGAAGEGLPLLEVVTRWRASEDEPVVAMVLTHPHQDHAAGFAELIEALEPQAIALAGDLLSAASVALEITKAASDRRKVGAVRAALLAIQRWAEEHPGRLLALHQGAAVPVPGGGTSVVARAPEAALLRAFLTEPGVRQRLKVEANHISVVLEIEHGTARVVLGGDLPRFRTGTTSSVPSGWDQVMSLRPELGRHHVLKIPHHGSAEAVHPVLMPTAGAGGRAWAVTPYNSSRLPRVADMDGLPQLLGWMPSILLTGIPASKMVQAGQRAPGVVALAQLASRYAAQPLHEPFLDAAGIELTPGDACEPLDPVWAVAVDRTGTVVGRWRGRAALEVVP